MSLVVILPGPEDLGAGQVASAIRRGGAEVLVVPGPVLEAAHWEHRVADGQSRTLVRLPDGTVLDDADPSPGDRCRVVEGHRAVAAQHLGPRVQRLHRCLDGRDVPGGRRVALRDDDQVGHPHVRLTRVEGGLVTGP